MKARVALVLLITILTLFTLLIFGLTTGRGLIVFDVCEEKAKDVVPYSESGKLSPVTEEELKNFPELKPGDMPSAFFHQVLKCRMQRQPLYYFRL